MEKTKMRKVDIILGKIQEYVAYAAGTKRYSRFGVYDRNTNIDIVDDYSEIRVEGVSVHHSYPDLSDYVPYEPENAEQEKAEIMAHSTHEYGILKIEHPYHEGRNKGLITISFFELPVKTAQCRSYCEHPHNGSRFDEITEIVPIEKLEKLLESKMNVLKIRAVEKAKENIINAMARAEIEKLEEKMWHSYNPSSEKCES